MTGATVVQKWCSSAAVSLRKRSHTYCDVTTALGGVTTSGVSGSSSSVWDVHSISLALLVPDSSIPGAASSASSTSPCPAALSRRSAEGVSGSVSVLAWTSPGWDRAELQRDKVKALITAPQPRVLPDTPKPRLVPVHGLSQGPSGVKAIGEDDDVILGGRGGGATPHYVSLLLLFLLLPHSGLHTDALHVRFLSFTCDEEANTGCDRLLYAAHMLDTCWDTCFTPTHDTEVQASL